MELAEPHAASVGIGYGMACRVVSCGDAVRLFAGLDVSASGTTTIT